VCVAGSFVREEGKVGVGRLPFWLSAEIKASGKTVVDLKKWYKSEIAVAETGLLLYKLVPFSPMSSNYFFL